MLQSLGIIAVSGIICLYELPKMKKSGMKKEMVVFISILGIATVLSVLKAIGINIPNPLDGIIKLLEPISNFIDSLFQSEGKG